MFPMSEVLNSRGRVPYPPDDDNVNPNSDHWLSTYVPPSKVTPLADSEKSIDTSTHVAVVVVVGASVAGIVVVVEMVVGAGVAGIVVVVEVVVGALVSGVVVGASVAGVVVVVEVVVGAGVAGIVVVVEVVVGALVSGVVVGAGVAGIVVVVEVLVGASVSGAVVGASVASVVGQRVRKVTPPDLENSTLNCVTISLMDTVSTALSPKRGTAMVLSFVSCTRVTKVA